jgi:hypothetical protein
MRVIGRMTQRVRGQEEKHATMAHLELATPRQIPSSLKNLKDTKRGPLLTRPTITSNPASITITERESTQPTRLEIEVEVEVDSGGKEERKRKKQRGKETDR